MTDNATEQALDCLYRTSLPRDDFNERFIRDAPDTLAIGYER